MDIPATSDNTPGTIVLRNADGAFTSDTIYLSPKTEAQRDAITTPPAGLILYNGTTNKLQVRTNTAWVDLH